MTAYTHGHADSVLRSHRWRTAENSAGYLLPHLHAGVTILDIGCGPGTITVDLAARVAPGRVLGIDPSADVVAEAAALERPAGASFAVGDVFALGAEQWDVVHAHQVLQHLSDPVAALRAMAAATVPGGLVAARDADYGGMLHAPHDPRLDRWQELYRAVARANGAEPDGGRHLLRWAHAAGLADVTVSATAWCFATPAERAWWGGLWAERTTSSGFATHAVRHGLATAGELEGLATAWREWTEQPDGVFIVPHGELLARA